MMREDETAINDLTKKERFRSRNRSFRISLFQHSFGPCPLRSSYVPFRISLFQHSFGNMYQVFFANKESAKKRNGHLCSLSVAKIPMLVATEGKDRTHWNHINQLRFHHPKSSLSAYSDTPWFSLYIRRGLKRSCE